MTPPPPFTDWIEIERARNRHNTGMHDFIRPRGLGHVENHTSKLKTIKLIMLRMPR
jgi:hypothetical protein